MILHSFSLLSSSVVAVSFTHWVLGTHASEIKLFLSFLYWILYEWPGKHRLAEIQTPNNTIKKLEKGENADTMDAFTQFLSQSIKMSECFNTSPSNFRLLQVYARTHSKTLLCMIKPPTITVLYHFYLHFHATYKRSKISLWYKYLYASPWQQCSKKPRLNAGIQIPLLRPGSLVWINLCVKLQHLY